MSDIQKARDVLAKWREAALPGPWVKDQDTDCDGTAQAAITTANGPLTWDDHSGEVFSPDTARLIVGTAGNPELLDAIDNLLAATLASYEAWGNRVGRLSVDKGGHVARLAAAVIAADERMSA